MADPNTYISPPPAEDYPPLGWRILGELELPRPMEPSAMPIDWSQVRTLDAAARGMTGEQQSANQGIVRRTTLRHVGELRHWLKAENTSGAVHRALSIGILVVPPVTVAPPELSRPYAALLYGSALGASRPNLPPFLKHAEVAATDSRVNKLLRGLFSSAGVHSQPELVCWGHKQGYLSSLRYHENPMAYYRDMSRVSRARQFLGAAYPDLALHELPNSIALSLAQAVPELITAQPDTREDYALHLRAWIDNEKTRFDDWLAAHASSAKISSGKRWHLVQYAKAVPFNDLLQHVAANPSP